MVRKKEVSNFSIYTRAMQACHPNATSYLLPNLTFYQITRHYHSAACQQGTFNPHLGLAYVLLVETNPFPKLVVLSPDLSLQTSLGTFSILLTINRVHPLLAACTMFDYNTQKGVHPAHKVISIPVHCDLHFLH